MKRQKCKGGVWLQSWDDIRGATRIFYSPPCGLKSCPTCAKLKQLSHIARIAIVVRHHNDKHWYFLTVTARAKYHKTKDIEGGLKSLRHAWSIARKRINRRYKFVTWVKVFERHKSGMYHLHIIIGLDGKMSQRWIKQALFEGGAGYQVKLLPVDTDGHAIRYVAKYATKADVPIRAVEYSRNFPKLAENAPLNPKQWYYLGNIDISPLIDYLTHAGINVVMLTANEEDADGTANS